MAEPDVTLLLRSIEAGEPEARERLIAAVYEDLRGLARARMRGERRGHTLRPTELVNEAWLRLSGGDAGWKNRAHFFGAAALAMRRILVEHARQRGAGKRGGGQQRVTFASLQVAADEPDIDVLALDEALEALARSDERLARLVHLRFFVGLTVEEAAELLGTSAATANRDWAYARAWLYRHMAGAG